MELINKATQKKSGYVKTLVVYKQKKDDDEEDDGDVEKLKKSKSQVAGSKEGNKGTCN